jgi:hypothetical protein
MSQPLHTWGNCPTEEEDVWFQEEDVWFHRADLDTVEKIKDLSLPIIKFCLSNP